jgi:iron(III) transport system ATP-binding protein
LVVRPKCLLLDEPLSNLDAKLRLEMRSEIRRIVKEHRLTGVYVTHDQEEALSMADRIAVMDGGHIHQLGTPQEIYRSPNSARIARFIGETNLVEASVERIVRDDGQLELRLATKAGQFQGYVSSRSWRPQVGSDVLLSIRPEALRLDNTGVPINRVIGSVIGRIYLGNSVQYELEGYGNQTWHVTEINPHLIREVGEQMVLSADPWDVVVLKS